MAPTMTQLITIAKMSIKLTSGKERELSTPGGTTELSSNNNLTFGQGALKNDIFYGERITLAGAASQTLVLGDDSLIDEFGDGIAFAKVKGIFLHNRSDDQETPTDAAVSVGGATVNPWQGFLGDAISDLIVLPAGYGIMIAGDDVNGVAVAAASNEQLKFLNDDGSDQAEIDVIIWGESL